MGMPGKRGLKMALKILDAKFGDKGLYMSRTEWDLTDGSRIREGDHEVISEMCLKLSSGIQKKKKKKKIGKLPHVDNPQVVRGVVDRLDSKLQSKWHTMWTGKRQWDIPRLKDIKLFLQKEMEAARSRHAHNPRASLDDRRGNAGRVRNAKTKSSTVALSNPQSNSKPRRLDLPLELTPSLGGRAKSVALSIVSCPTFRSLRPAQRKGVVTVQRCFICLKVNHMSKHCKAKLCDVNNCGQRHTMVT
ncbi:uncharacterized protein [Penaeus vannamei]|uniref:uncharacterized protein n=1 Tax=Penaeus vannamei TaxID=6689 RepID=UPI00387FA18B